MPPAPLHSLRRPSLAALLRQAALLLALLLAACPSRAAEGGGRDGGAAGCFVRRSGTGLTLGGEPYHFVGANAWYLPILASGGQGGDPRRLGRELDRLQRLGVANLRILVGADGQPAPRKVSPVLQPRPGEYNDTLLAGLDRLMAELGRRRMKAVLYLNNSWTWSGGYAAYIRWAGLAQEEPADSAEWTAWCAAAAQFSGSIEARHLFMRHVRHIVGRRNSVTGRPYAEDPAIMAWQIGNEPRAFAPEAKGQFAQWVAEAAATVRSLDPNHLISVGSEGLTGCEADMDLYARLHADPNIDYLTIHIWPRNWGWVDREAVASGRQKPLMRSQLAGVYARTEAYIRLHADVARRLGKPLVIEEFGYPRDGGSFDPQASTVARDAYFRFVLDHVVRSRRDSGVVAGANFWGWNGEARRRHIWWQPSDPYMADPPQEQQGLYGVFDSDRTCRIIRREARQLK